tara:strand:+ start:260 stop:880 length:621 start_codon:yes stop_codon:yes gene_type:complete
MSYNRTVYCGHCRGKGHNRRGCPQRKDYIANNPDSYLAHREALARERRKSNPRRCSYCSQSGHNARKCEVKTKDKVTLAQKLSYNRAIIMTKMVENGMGIGALVEITRTYRRKVNNFYLLTGIRWDLTDEPRRVLMEIVDVVDGSAHTIAESIQEGEYNNISVISGVDKEEVRRIFPSDWRMGTLYDEETYFPKGSGRSYWHFDEE